MNDFQSNGTWAWRCLPKEVSSTKDSLSFVTRPETDFWYVPDTHNDNGHFFYTTVEDSFVATVQITGNYSVVYDQIGFLLRANDKLWVKTGIEYFNNFQHMSTVVTRGETEYSDWNVTLLNHITSTLDKDNNISLVTKFNPSTLYLRLTRLMMHNTNKILIEYSYDNKEFQFFRKFYFAPNTKKFKFGLMACTPKRLSVGNIKEEQFIAKFDNFNIKILNENDVKKFEDPVPDDAKDDTNDDTNVTTQKV